MLVFILVVILFELVLGHVTQYQVGIVTYILQTPLLLSKGRRFAAKYALANFDDSEWTFDDMGNFINKKRQLKITVDETFFVFLTINNGTRFAVHPSICLRFLWRMVKQIITEDEELIREEIAKIPPRDILKAKG